MGLCSLSAFNPKSLMVSPAGLREVNHLRRAFRKELPSYDIPQCSTKPNTKRKLTGNAHQFGPPQKKSKQDQKPKQVHNSDPIEIQGSPLIFHPVDEHWQQPVCTKMGLCFYGKNRVRPGNISREMVTASSEP